MPDGWEIQWGLDALDPTNAHRDPDRDRVSNLRECQINTVPTGLFELTSTTLPSRPNQSAILIDRSPDQSEFLINLSASNFRLRPVIVNPDASPAEVHLPALSAGKTGKAYRWSDTGFVIGMSTASNHRQRIVYWDLDYPDALPVPVLSDVGEGSQSIIDVSENDDWILARWQKADGSYTVGAINFSDPLDNGGGIPHQDLAVPAEQLAPGESIKWTRITNQGQLLGIRKTGPDQAGQLEFSLVTRASLTAFGASADPVDLLLTPIASSSENWPSVAIVGDVENQNYLAALSSYPSYSGFGVDFKKHYLIRDHGSNGNIAPSTEAVLLDLPESPSYRVLDTNQAGELLAHRSPHGFINRGHGTIRLDALRIIPTGSALQTSTSAQNLPTLGTTLQTNDCRPVLLARNGEISGLIRNPDRSLKLWTITEKTDLDANGLVDDWQVAYQEWAGIENGSDISGETIDQTSGESLFNLSAADHIAGGIISTRQNWLSIIEEIIEMVQTAPRLVIQKKYLGLTYWEEDDTDVDTNYGWMNVSTEGDFSRGGDILQMVTNAVFYDLWLDSIRDGHEVFFATLNRILPMSELLEMLDLFPWVYDDDGRLDPEITQPYFVLGGKIPSIHQLIHSKINTRDVTRSDGTVVRTENLYLENIALQIQLEEDVTEDLNYQCILVGQKWSKDAEGKRTKVVLPGETRVIEFTIEEGDSESQVFEIVPDETHFVKEGSQNYSIIYDLLSVEVVELSPKVKDEDGNEIDGSEIPRQGELLTPFAEEDPHRNRIAHRELKVRIGEALKGKDVTWTLEPLFVPHFADDGPNLAPTFRGEWSDSPVAAHQNAFEASSAYGENEFEIESDEGEDAVAKTTIDDDGFTAIRVINPTIK